MTWNMNYIKTLIFDFDGTIADTLPHIIAIANSFVKEYGIKRLQKRSRALKRKDAMADNERV